MNPSRRLRPVRSAAPTPGTRQPELLFCAVCQVSIARAELENGQARRTPKGRMFCGPCATATPEERDRRREELEIEFADDAPVPAPTAVARPRTAAPPPAEHAEPDLPPPLAHSTDDPILEARVGELERVAFRTNARLRSLEERLDAALRRLDARNALP